MIKLAKNMMGTAAAAAALAGMSVPAQARDYYDRDRDGISVGEVIAGAVIIGGIAAVLSGGRGSNNRYDDRDYRRGDDRYDRYDYNNGYDNYGSSRAAINQCVGSVEKYASRYNRSKVTEIQGIERTRDGYRVSGNLVVRESGNGYNNYNNYDDRYGRDDRDSNRYGRGYDRGYNQGRFTCYVERGRVTDIQYRGLDQWR